MRNSQLRTIDEVASTALGAGLFGDIVFGFAETRLAMRVLVSEVRVVCGG